MANQNALHYVDNKQFTTAIVAYVSALKQSRKDNIEEPPISEYIGACFLKIAEGLSHKPNFISYTYREEMVMDAVENCLKAIANYDIDVKTRTGKPNPFAYFTQICFYAFLRRIAKEKKQQDIKALYMEYAGIDSFANFDDLDNKGQGIVERVRNRANQIHDRDLKIKQFGRSMKKKKTTLVSTIDAFIQ